MKKIFVIIYFVSVIIFGQTDLELYSFSDAKEYGGLANLVEIVHKHYIPTNKFVSTDSITSAWFDDFYPKFKKFIINKKLNGGKDYNLWMELGCSNSGSVEKIIYKLMNADIDENKVALENALREFFKTYKYSLALGAKYRQCGNFTIKQE